MTRQTDRRMTYKKIPVQSLQNVNASELGDGSERHVVDENDSRSKQMKEVG